MRTFSATLPQDRDSAFGPAFPPLPGCLAASDTRDGPQTAPGEAIHLWFDDQPGRAPPAFRVIVAPADH